MALFTYCIIYSIDFLGVGGGVVTYILSYSLVNLNCGNVYSFKVLRNDYSYVFMLCKFEIYSLFQS
jgi:hypothetical protein